MSIRFWPAPFLATDPFDSHKKYLKRLGFGEVVMGEHPKQPRLDARRAEFGRIDTTKHPGYHRPGSYSK